MMDVAMDPGHRGTARMKFGERACVTFITDSFATEYIWLRFTDLTVVALLKWDGSYD